MSRAKRTRKARMTARRVARMAALSEQVQLVRARHLDAMERAELRGQIEASDAPEPIKAGLGMLVDPVGYALDMVAREIERRQCPHCASNGIKASLEAVFTARGEVGRCWQCGGEYRDGKLVWPTKETS